ncbi:hypothetical protein [Streptacidiphilus jiangxiensis]|uniref:ABC-type transport system involved in multi-copper enzyme maturation, permease component n=1 Tax=Streptacidiphilus jiangxiensis TaxID=235985 RepID=A0A1H7ZTU6_STRJI|nr:hypothetical protein [Streptacidiphilus jiangxiensis]SEM62062.1 hypothetical protein SAMN05414137_13814 [Streptacidiphilus jiangxiensis]
MSAGTSATAAPAAIARPRRVTAHLRRLLRLLQLELRHSAMVWMLPVAIALFWLTTYRKDMAMPPLWNLRAAGLQTGAVACFAVPVTGAAAWEASREARRRLGDQLTVTVRPRWERQVASWLAITVWATAAYLGCVACLYGVTASQASWGGPLWWPVVVAGASLPAFGALGFVLGTLLPGRFTAPVATVAVFFALVLSTQPIHGGRSAWQVTPIVTGGGGMGLFGGSATFHPFAADLAKAQVMFLAGLTVALLGLLALLPGAAGRAARWVGAALAGAGLASVVTAVALTGTGTLGVDGMLDIPALHDPATDRPLRYTPVCDRGPIPLCVNPAYAPLLQATSHALAPVTAQLAGLPGAPTRIVQTSTTYGQDAGSSRTTGRGTGARGDGARGGDGASGFHLILPVQQPGPTMTADQMAAQVAADYGPQLVARVVGDGPDASDAQNAVARALLLAAGLADPAASSGAAGPGHPGLDAPDWPTLTRGSAAYAACERFTALPETARRAWLVQHLAALRAGSLTPEQLP